jgi:hypothetical protein
MASYTRGKWEAFGDRIGARDKDGEPVAITDGCLNYEAGADGAENATRIVACVNACARMGDPEAEIARLRAIEHAAVLLVDGVRVQRELGNYPHEGVVRTGLMNLERLLDEVTR